MSYSGPYGYRAQDTGNTPIPTIGNPVLVNDNQGRFNMVGNLTNPNNNILQRVLPNTDKQSLQRAVNSVIGTPGVTYGSELVQQPSTYPSVKVNYDNEIAAKTKMCEAVRTTTGNPFSSSRFAADCGVCVKGGVDSTGKGHLGGMLLLENDRQAGRNDANAKGLRNPRYSPTIGSCEPGYFAADKEALDRIRNRLACETNQSFGVPGCVQNYDTSQFFYAEDAAYEPPTLVLAGSGVARLGYIQRSGNGWSGSKMIAEFALSETWKEVPIPVQTNNQSSYFTLVVSPPAGADVADPATANSIYVAAALRGPTSKGLFVKDMGSIFSTDTNSGKTPRLRGTIGYKGKRITAIKPGKGAQIVLPFSIPISFLNTTLPDTRASAPSSGVISSEADAKLLNSGVCFAKGSGPGNYSKDCITSMFEGAGCTDQGTIHPSRNNNLLNDINTKKLDLDGMATAISGFAKVALTGSDISGNSVSIEQWNNASMMCLGRKIGGPCDGPNSATGPLTDACINALYLNKGGPITGTTYSTGQKNASLSGNLDQFCTPHGTAAPIGPDGKIRQAEIEKARRLGGVEPVKKYFDELHRKALDNTLSNEDRDKFMMACYGKRTVGAGGDAGTRARYVRILRAPDIGNDPQCLMIQEIRVFDTQGKNVAPQGKAMMSVNPWNEHMSANNALKYNMGMPAHDDCRSGNAANTYFELDLGNDIDIAFITYLNTAWNQSRANGMKLQLFDTSRKMVAERIFGLDYIRTFRFLKAPESGANDIPYLIKEGMHVMLSNLRGRDNKRFYIATTPHPAYGYTQCQPTSVPDYLVMGAPNVHTGANVNNQKPYVSLRSPSGQFLRHTNFVIHAHTYQDTDVFRADSTFEIIYPGIQSKSPNTISFRSYNFPSRYLAIRNPQNINAAEGYMILEPSDNVNLDFVIEPASIDMSKLPLEVYNYHTRIDPMYTEDKGRAEWVCKGFGGRLAREAELSEAQKKGGAWCTAGWVENGKRMWPMQDINNNHIKQYCRNPYTVNQWETNIFPGKANATCYGPKPPMSAGSGRAMSFQESLNPAWAGPQTVKGVYSQFDM